MSLAVRATDHRLRPGSGYEAGDVVSDLARRYAARMNQCEFAATLRSRTLSRRRYVAFLATMYPAVVGFNRALIRSIAKVDHVRNSTFVGALAEQLKEEQAHNQLWRDALATFGVQHEKLYADLETYLARFTPEQLDLMTAATLAEVSNDLAAGASGNFPGANFPDTVLALCHLLGTSATHEQVGYWEHFASQAGIEMVIWEVVSATILPAVLGNPELDLGDATTRWWREHGRLPGAQTGQRTDEEKHLELSRLALNRSAAANGDIELVAARAENAMRLFAACMLCQESFTLKFPLDRYLAPAATRRQGGR